MHVDDLTVGEVKALAGLLRSAPEDHPYQVGQVYFIRTVTHYFTGKLVKVTAQELVLTDAAWIADTGRLADALTKGGTFNEVEPFPDGEVIVGRSAVIDACRYPQTLRTQKRSEERR